jgi:hypothetical protein
MDGIENALQFTDCPVIVCLGDKETPASAVSRLAAYEPHKRR